MIELVTTLPPPVEEQLGAHLREVFLEAPFSPEQLRAEASAYCAELDHPFVLVSIPFQENDEITVAIDESRIAEITIEGNRYFTADTLLPQLRAEKGTPIHPRALEQDLAWLNRNPFRSCDLVLSPGIVEGQTNLELSVRDRLPFRPYAGSDNSGTETTSPIRLFGGFQWGDVLRLDHTLSYQFTAAPNPTEFQAHTASYLAPLPWRHLLNVFGTYAQADRLHDAHNRTQGRNWQASLRYQIPIGLRHEFQFGFDYKSLHNAHLLDTSLVNTHDGTVRQLEGRYAFTHLNSHLEAEGFLCQNYAYTRLALQHLFLLPADFSLDILARGQLATTSDLIATEQFALGGYDSIRGYPERFLNVASGLTTSVEAHTPPLLRYATLLLFSDFGYGDSTPLLSAGPGLRLSAAPYFNARLDYGLQLLSTLNRPALSSYLHFSATASY